MKFGEITVISGKRVVRWLAELGFAIIAPKETRAKKQAEVVAKLLEIANSLGQSRQRHVEWKIEQYKKLGLSEDKIRSRLLQQIEECKDPLSILIELIEKKVIVCIFTEDSDLENHQKADSNHDQMKVQSA